MPEFYRSMGEAEGAAMAHNARMAADLAKVRVESAHARGEDCDDPQCGPCSFDRAIPKEN